MKSENIIELLNPVRIKLIQLIIQKGEATTKELSESLPDIPTTSLYRHISKLLTIGVLEIISETRVRGTIERKLKLKFDPFEYIADKMENGDSEVHYNIYYSFLMSQLNDFVSYTSSETYDLKRDLVGFRTCMLNLNDEDCMSFISELTDIMCKYTDMSSDGNRRMRKFSFSLLPVNTKK